MHTSIMVPLDGSSRSDAAIPVAATLAKQSGATLELVHVDTPLANPGRASMVDLRGDDAEPGAWRAQFETAATRLWETSGIAAVATLLTGPAIATLEMHVAARAPDLIVMTTHGLGGPGRFLVGSVADALLRRTGVPILLVRRPAVAANDRSAGSHSVDGHTIHDRPGFRHVLIPLDGSERAEAIVPHAVALGEPDTTEFTLLTVIVPLRVTANRTTADRAAADRVLDTTPASPHPPGRHWDGPLDVIERREREASAYLEQIATELRQCSMTVTTHVVVHEQAAQAILNVAAECRADVIAIATHGRHPLPRWVIGSVADRIVGGTDVPVLVFRPRPAQARDWSAGISATP